MKCLALISLIETVPDYRELQRRHNSSLDSCEYRSEQAIGRFHGLIGDLQRTSLSAKFTWFHKLLSRFAIEGRLLRHYTQNVDCIEQRVPQLSAHSVQLYGRIDQLRCSHCGWFDFSDFQFFSGSNMPECGHCLTVSMNQERIGERRTRVGTLRPNIVLHGEDTESYPIKQAITYDLKAVPDVVVVVGTRLHISGARKIATKLCQATREQGGTTIWLSKSDPPPGMAALFNVVLTQDCDKLASIYCEA